MTGAGGLVGGRLAQILSRDFAVVAARHRAPTPPGLDPVDLDLRSPTSLDAALDRARPHAILHAAALADADGCEQNPAEAEALNVQAGADLARRCQLLGIRLVGLSTDLVFAGARSFYREADPPEPVMVYGRTKHRGEQAILAEAPESALLRVSLIAGGGFGPRPTASEAVAWALRAGRPLRLFTDQYRTPVDPESVAAAAAAVLVGNGQGLYHLGGPERMSRHDLGLRVALVLGLAEGTIAPVTRSAMPLAAPRPPDASLDSGRAIRELAWVPRPVDDAIRGSRPAPGKTPRRRSRRI